MINPNIDKLVTVEVINQGTRYNGEPIQVGRYKTKSMANTAILEIYNYGLKPIKPGKRRLHLRYSITTDSYYLSNR